MTYKLKIRKVGNSAGLTLPKEALAELRLKIGDEIQLVETKDGFLLTPYDPSFEAGLAAFEKTRGKFRNALRKLGE
jgi:putative addiction module antidote